MKGIKGSLFIYVLYLSLLMDLYLYLLLLLLLFIFITQIYIYDTNIAHEARMACYTNLSTQKI